MPSSFLCSEDRANEYVKNYLQKSDEFFYLLCDYIFAYIVLKFIVIIIIMIIMIIMIIIIIVAFFG